MQSGFYLKVNDHLQRFAEQHVYARGDWRQSVLDDLLYDGKLRGEIRRDQKTTRESFWFYGRAITIQCAADTYRNDTLFAVGIFPSPQKGGRKPGGPLNDIPGPWMLATLSRAKGSKGVQITVEEHIRRMLDVNNRPHLGVLTSAGPKPRSTASTTLVHAPEITIPPSPLTVPTHLENPDATTSEGPSTASPGSIKTAPPTTEPLSGAWFHALCAAHIARTPSLEGLIDAADIVAARAGRLEALASRKSKFIIEIEELQQRLDQLTRECTSVHTAIDDLPTVEALEALRDSIDELTALGQYTSLPPPSSLRIDDSLHVRLESCALVARSQLPAWAFPENKLTALDACIRTTDDKTINEIAQWIRTTVDASTAQTLANLVDPETPGLGIVARLDSAWAAHRRRTELLEHLPARARLAAETVPSQVLQEVALRLRTWLDVLNEAAFDALVDSLRGNGSEEWLRCTPVLPRGSLLPEPDRKYVREISNPAMAIDLALRLLTTNSPSTPPQLAEEYLLDFGHAVTNEQGHVIAAMIVPPHFDHANATAQIQIPIRLKFPHHPSTAPFEVFITAPHLGMLPETEHPGDTQVTSRDGRRGLVWNLQIEKGEVEKGDGESCTVDRKLSIPITRKGFNDLKGKELRLSFHTGTHTRQLTFSRILSQLPTPPQLDAQIEPQVLVTKHALGVQVLHSQLEPYIRQGGPSFMVAAPRRFGKTTLLQYLARMAAEQPDVMVTTVNLDRHLTAEESAQAVFHKLDAAIREKFQASPLTENYASLFDPDNDTFDRVQAFLAKNGIRALLVFVDEAQVLVPRQRTDWGNQLKRLIETKLANPPSGLPRVMFGLFGTNDLGLKLGRNCRDFLSGNGGELYEFEERPLAKYLREVGQETIESTRRAREELARWTGNLWTLKLVLRGLIQRMQNERRTFILDKDVRNAVDEILRSDTSTTESVWSYASSELSYSDEWDPIDGFPLAVAWAREDSLTTLTERLAACQSWLQLEAERLGVYGHITRERLELCMSDLKGRGILRDDANFRRPMLRALLRGRADTCFAGDKKNALSLERLLVDLVRWPTSAFPCGEGAQARIFLQPDSDPPIAYRICDLANEADRRRFIRTCAVVRRLRPVSTALDGDRYLPRVRAAGFSADNPLQGIISYDWIHGNSLEGQWRALPVYTRIRIGEQIARALSALHTRSVVHCDVRPRNIIVDGSLNARLIDFGLSRTYDDEARTRMGEDEFTAPELRTDPPKVTAAADIYALGVFLKVVNEGLTTGGFERDLVERMTSTSPLERPHAQDVAAGLEEILRSYTLQDQLYTTKRDVEAIVIAASDVHDWLLEALHGYVDACVARQAGLIPWDQHRLLETAFYVNNVFTVCLKNSTTGTLAELRTHTGNAPDVSLANLRTKLQSGSITPRSLSAWQTADVHFVGLLRLAWAHPEKKRDFLRDACKDLRISQNADLLQPGTERLRRIVKMIDKSIDARGHVETFFGKLFPPTKV